MFGPTLDGRAQERPLCTQGVWAETRRRSQSYRVCGKMVLAREGGRSSDPVASMSSSFVTERRQVRLEERLGGGYGGPGVSSWGQAGPPGGQGAGTPFSGCGPGQAPPQPHQ